MQGVDAPFYYLANEFHKMYQERIEVFKSIGMQWSFNNWKTIYNIPSFFSCCFFYIW